MKITTNRLSDDVQIDLEAIAGSTGMLFARGNTGIATRGIAAVVDSSDAKAFLQTLECDDNVGQPGSGPILMGAVPFDSALPHHFVLPEVAVVRHEDGTAWVTTVGDAQPTLSPCPIGPAAAGGYSIRPGVSVDHYLRAVEMARDSVRNGDLTKAVIARDILVSSEAPIDVHALLMRLRASFGSSYRYSFDGLVGASPELLVSRDGPSISSHPLAGTTNRTGDPETDQRLAAALSASTKNQVEHRVVIDMVHDTLLPYCSFLDWEPEPNIVTTANVQHLGTRLMGHLSEPYLHVLDAVYALSPTPALGGHPREEALKLIAQHEGLERGRYGGAIGWFDLAGNGTFAVAIRCAELSPDRLSARLFAGGGIVAESDPLAELAETQAKFQAMLAAIIRP